MTNSQHIAELVPAMRQRVVNWLAACAKRHDLPPVVLTSSYRSIESQQEIYRKGRRNIPGEKIVTRAVPGRSWHNYRRAVDFAFVVDGRVSWPDGTPEAARWWRLAGELAEQQGMEWGGRFRSLVDRPHVQFREGKTIDKMMAEAGGVS